MRRLVVAMWVVLIALIPAHVYSQAALEPSSGPSETWRNVVPVSGGVKTGVMFETAEALDPSSLTVWLATTDWSRLCVTVTSQDARYFATVEYDVTRRPAGMLRLHLPTKYAAKLAPYRPLELAILAQLGNECDTPGGPIAVAAWKAPSASGPVIVLLNSRLPTTIVAGAKIPAASSPASAAAAEPQGPLKCTALTGTLTAYNLRCDVPRTWISPSIPLVARVRRGTAVTDIPLSLRLP
jgi:hypothetical protein